MEKSHKDSQGLERMKNKYRDMLQLTDLPSQDNQPPKFITVLRSNITQGPAGIHHVKTQLDLLEEFEKTELLADYPDDELSPMHLAAFFYEDAEMIKRLADLCPGLIWKQRTGEYKGQTVLHILIIRQNTDGAEAILQYTDRKDLGRSGWLLNGKATGSGFKKTVMMGELPLSVAALTFNWDMVKKLDDHGAELHGRNSHGDTVFHSLVQYAADYPQKLTDVKTMTLKLHGLLLKKCANLEVKTVQLMYS
ncbi:hypothetical protein BaRGS_00006858 [Batillaria attramentaria]|uniref:Uncharacterized protein n=1 Tax=Batillaria attramentaria TaxID=370345 RepID=A0ABD0LQZ8_9CAEN